MRASGDPSASIFGFSEFVGAFALLVIVFTIVGVRYRFRISIAPFRLLKTTFFVIGIIGFGTLATDVWISEGWLIVPVPHMTQGLIQGAFGFAFLSLAMVWIYFAFISPPIFSNRNFKTYAQELFSVIVKGSESELPIIAHELARSADAIVELYARQSKSKRQQTRADQTNETSEPTVTNYANDIMLLIGNRKLCRYIIESSPITAIKFFQAAVNREAYHVPLGQFATNVSAEAINNTDSILYHEDHGFRSGLIGYIKPFSQAIYGNYRLVEGLGSNHASPLDIGYTHVNSWNATQLEAYCRVVVITYADRLEAGYWRQHSYSIQRAFGNIENACHGLHALNDVTGGDPDISARLRIAVDFVMQILDLIDKQEDVTPSSMRPNKNVMRRDIYDRIAEMMLELIFKVSSVTKPEWECWHLQHNTVWSRFFDRSGKSKSRTIVQYKLRRMIYDEILLFDEFVNYKSACFLGICLNTMGVKFPVKVVRDVGEAPLHKAVISWVKKNYLSVRSELPDVGDACLMGGISFNKKKNRLVRTYAKHLRKKAPKDYLQL